MVCVYVCMHVCMYAMECRNVSSVRLRECCERILVLFVWEFAMKEREGVKENTMRTTYRET